MSPPARALHPAPKPTGDSQTERPEDFMARYLEGLSNDEAAVLEELARRDREVGPPAGAPEAEDPDAP